jgi:hypothetical protein
MAAPDATVSRLGAINNAVSTETAIRAMFLKVFGGEVLTMFETATTMLDKHLVRTIDHGKSAQFPFTGQISAAYHTPGKLLIGTVVPGAERVITIDGLLLTQAFIANIDEAMNHYDVRSIYSTEMGRALSKQFDKNVMQEVIIGARAALVVTGGSGGSQISLGTEAAWAALTTKQKAAQLAVALFAAAQTLDENDVPDSDRYAVFPPAFYYILAQNTDLINKDWGGAGAYSEGDIFRVAGITILKSNNLPSTDLSGADYHGVDATGDTAVGGTKGIVFAKDAVGTVKLMDMAVEGEYEISRQGHLMVAKYAIGHGYLRPESCIEIGIGDTPGDGVGDPWADA